jgi:hypothetical protein
MARIILIDFIGDTESYLLVAICNSRLRMCDVLEECEHIVHRANFIGCEQEVFAYLLEAGIVSTRLDIQKNVVEHL